MRRKANVPKRSHSFSRQVTRVVLLAVIPLALLLVFFSARDVRVQREELLSARLSSCRYTAYTVADSLSGTEAALAGLTVNNEQLIRLRYGLPELDAHLAGYEIMSLLEKTMDSQTLVYAFGLISEKNQLERFIFRDSGGTWAEHEALRQRVLAQCAAYAAGAPVPARWTYLELPDRPCLLRVMGTENAWVCAVADLSMIPVRAETVDGVPPVCFVDEEGRVLTERALLGVQQVALDGDKTIRLAVNGAAYSLTPVRVEDTHLWAMALMPDSTLNAVLRRAALFLALAGIVMVAALLVCALVFRGTVLIPLRRFTAVMERVREGEVGAQMSEGSGVAELEEAVSVFNRLSDEIQTLKIRKYEDNLAIRATQIQYLQIQMHQHFYLNQLKILYALAEGNKREQIQDRILRISRTMRYRFGDFRRVVQLGEDIAIASDYATLVGGDITLECRADADARAFPVPPLLVQNFVENAIKHSLNLNGSVRVTLDARLEQGGNRLRCVLRDNGNGYDADTLARISRPDYVNREKVGIANLKQRVSLLYGADAELLFYNDGGACMAVSLPRDAKEAAPE